MNTENKKTKGRPSKYKDEFKERLIEFMKEGYSVAEVCLELGICKQTFYNWCDENKDFLDSKKKGIDFSEGWWMKQGRTNLENKEFSYTGWYMNMKNRFGWADRQETNQTQTIKVEGMDQKTTDALSKNLD